MARLEPQSQPFTAARLRRSPCPLRTALVLQGGGALGAYQAGVYEALAQHSRQPDWLAGVSIGAINAAIIAGNHPERRLERLRAFWEQSSSELSLNLPYLAAAGDDFRIALNRVSAILVAALGAPGFFRPRPFGPHFAAPGTPAALSYYDTEPLRETLLRLVDFERLNGGDVRLMLGAVNISTGNNVVFDSAKTRIGPEHVMASGALPPGFPPVEIEGEYYWDGGLVSNTPLEFVLDAAEGQYDLLVMQVDLFPARGPVPRTLLEAGEREKDIRYSSRTQLATNTLCERHDVRYAINELHKLFPPKS